MTINERPAGRICRIGNINDGEGEHIYDMNNEFLHLANQRIPNLIVNGSVLIPNNMDAHFVETILLILDDYLQFRDGI